MSNLKTYILKWSCSLLSFTVIQRNSILYMIHNITLSFLVSQPRKLLYTLFYDDAQFFFIFSLTYFPMTINQRYILKARALIRDVILEVIIETYSTIFKTKTILIFLSCLYEEKPNLRNILICFIF